MGRDKARLRLGTKTLLGWARAAARASGLPVRVVRQDRVPRCGPLGGVLTALEGRGGGTTLFLSCDMPLLGPGWLQRVEKATRGGTRAVFTERDGLAGFPFALPAEALPLVRRQLESGALSLQSLAKGLNAVRLRPARRESWRFLNINTPEDLHQARAHLECAEPRSRPAYNSKARTRRNPSR